MDTICDEALIDSLFKEYQFNKVVHFAAESQLETGIILLKNLTIGNLKKTRAS